MNDCLFCKLVKGNIPSHTIYEDNKTIAFLDVNPLTRGHSVIIPKEHFENVVDLPEYMVAPVFTSVKRVTEMIQSALGIKDFTIGINQGKISGQMVNHLHIHVIPRYKDDGGGSIHSIVNQPPNEDIEDTKKKILESNK